MELNWGFELRRQNCDSLSQFQGGNTIENLRNTKLQRSVAVLPLFQTLQSTLLIFSIHQTLSAELKTPRKTF